jgi:DNA helicase-2/ATP-dependent DNA helicase PcrA
VLAVNAGSSSLKLAVFDAGLREVAVLARLWAQTLGLELAFLERGVPYVKAARSVFEVPEVIGLLGWLRLAAGSLSEEVRVEDVIRQMLSTPTLWLQTQHLTALARAMADDPGRGPELLAASARKAVMSETPRPPCLLDSRRDGCKPPGHEQRRGPQDGTP